MKQSEIYSRIVACTGTAFFAVACSTPRLIVREAQENAGKPEVVEAKGAYTSYRLQNLLYLKQYCATQAWPEGPEPECDARAIDSQIETYRKRFEVSPGIVVLPEGGNLGLVKETEKVFEGYSYNQAGGGVNARPEYSYENTGRFRFCGRVFNLTGRPLRSVSLQIDALDKTGAKLAGGPAIASGPLLSGDSGLKAEISWFHGLILIVPLIWPSANLLYSETSENAVACTKEGFAVSKVSLGQLGFQVESAVNP